MLRERHHRPQWKFIECSDKPRKESIIVYISTSHLNADKDSNYMVHGSACSWQSEIAQMVLLCFPQKRGAIKFVSSYWWRYKM
jgi:hypothetical protein